VAFIIDMDNEFTRATPDLPIIPAEPSSGGGDNIRLGIQVEVPFTLYESKYNKTYTEEYFNLEGQDTSPIENYIRSRIEKQNLNDSLKTYDNLINGIFDKIGVNEDETQISKFTKVVKYIQLLSRNKDKDERYRDLIKKQRNEETRREELKEKMLQSSLEKAKTEKEQMRLANEKMKQRISEMGIENIQRLKKIEYNRKELSEKIEMIKREKETMEKENKKLINNLEEISDREQILINKHNKLRELI